MPQAETAFAVGVIREREKELLEEDEFTRLIEAKSKADALKTVVETIYGRWIEGEISQGALEAAFKRERLELHNWIRETVADVRVIKFISARFDGLNAATAILQSRKGSVKPEELSELGYIDPMIWQSVLDNNLGWESLPQVWKELVRDLPKDASNSAVVEACGEAARKIKKENAAGRLMKDIARMEEEQFRASGAMRPVTDGEAAAAFDMAWDEKIIDLIRPYRYEPEGVDPIIAYWYAKEFEVKNLRWLLSGKMSGRGAKELYGWQRSLYLVTK